MTAMPEVHRSDQIGQMMSPDLDLYAGLLGRCLDVLGLDAPIRADVLRELASVRTEQDAREKTRDHRDAKRRYQVGELTTGELERTRRELRASLALMRADSPARAPVVTYMQAIDTELDARAEGQCRAYPAL